MKTLNRKQLFFYGIAGIGPNMINTIVGAYLCDALLTVGFSKNIENWTYLNKAVVVAFLLSIFITIAKIIDGVSDIPLGAWTDHLKTKWGKRRPAILLGVVPMMLAYYMLLIVPNQAGLQYDASGDVISNAASILNTVWFGLWLALFYTFYTLTMVTYYATFSEVTASERDRVFLSNVKSGVDIIYFVLAYALIPALIGGINIRPLALIFSGMIVSMIIPFILIKERSTRDADVQAYRLAHPEDVEAQKEEEPRMIDSIKYTFKNKDFMIWMIIDCALQFGLQIFLTGFNVYYSGTMGFTGMQTMIVNIAGFAPVPFTLILYNYITKKKGFKFSFEYALGIFTLGMLIAVFCRPQIFPNASIRLAVAVVANLICSFGIGSFFSVTYTVPSQIACDEKAKTGRSHPAMYFAIQGLFSGITTAIATGLVWVNIKKIPDDGLFFCSPAGGSGLLTLIVALFCMLAFGLSFLLPKSLVNVGKVEKKVADGTLETETK